MVRYYTLVIILYLTNYSTAQFRDDQSICGPACINCTRDRCLRCSEGYGIKETYCRSCETNNCAKCGDNYKYCEECFPGYFVVVSKDGTRECKSCIEGCVKCKNEKDCEKCEFEKYVLNENKTCEEAFFTPITSILFLVLVVLWAVYCMLNTSIKQIKTLLKKYLFMCVLFPFSCWKNTKKVGRKLIKKRLQENGVDSSATEQE